MRYVWAMVVAAVLVTGCASSPRPDERQTSRSTTEEVVADTATEPSPAPRPTWVPLDPSAVSAPSEVTGGPGAPLPPAGSATPVATPPPAPPAGAAAAAAPAAAGPDDVEATTQQAYGLYTLNVNHDGSLVRWDPCRTIRWEANLALAPPDALDELRVAFDELAEATGMEFVYSGETSAMPTKAWLEGPADRGTILVAWAPKAGTDLWSGNADGEGGWYKRGVSTDGSTWTWRIERGFVVIDPESTVAYAAGFGRGVSLGALLLHELAHAVGLGHVEDDHQLMFPTLGGRTAARYGDGDLAGLARVGREAGCIA